MAGCSWFCVVRSSRGWLLMVCVVRRSRSWLLMVCVVKLLLQVDEVLVVEGSLGMC